jgi:F-type H+-transporting ATPase subunit b
MLINWFTVISQAINFLILLWLMKRFLYKPILTAIDKRETKIAETIAKTKVEKEKIDVLKIEVQKKKSDFENNQNELLKKGQEDAKQEKTKLLKDAKNEADESRKKWHESLVTEQKDINEKFQQLVLDEIFSITQKALKDLASVQLEESMTQVFIDRLTSLAPEEITVFKLALKTQSSPLIVQSTFSLTEAQQKDIQDTVQNIFESTLSLQFETSPSLVSGIRLTINGKRIEWSITNYLENLQTKMSEIVKPPTIKTV